MKNLRQILFCAVLLLSFTSFKGFAQAPEWEWAKVLGGYSSGNCITTDSFGNTYLTGSFAGNTLILGKDTLKNASLYNLQVSPQYAKTDLFCVKYDSNDNVRWAKAIGDTGKESGNSIAIDKNGNTYVTGYFDSPFITFGTTKIVNSKVGIADIFIVKYDVNGNVLWAKGIGGNGIDVGNGISIDRKGNPVLTGYFTSSSIIFGSDTLYNSGAKDIIILKYDSGGKELWAQSAGAKANDFANSIAIDSINNIYITGTFESTSIKFGDDTLINSGHYDVFVTKYNSDGQVAWASSAGGKYYDEALRIAVDGNANIYITGAYFSPMIGFGSDTLMNTDFDPDGTKYDDVFTVKYNSDGNILWARSSIGTGFEVGNSIATDDFGNVYITGLYWGKTVVFGKDTLNSSYYWGGGYNEIFVVKYSSEGQVLWAKTAGGAYMPDNNGNDEGKSITVDKSGDVLITGTCQSAISFGKLSFNRSYGMFIAKLSSKTTSITEETNNTKINIFPNPTASQFHITNLEPGNWTITIYTLDGQSVFKKEISESNATIDLSGKAKGAYVYRLLKDGEVFKSGKIVIE